METVIVALGSNLGHPYREMNAARSFLRNLANNPDTLQSSAIYQTEPIGPSEYPFLNAAIAFDCDLEPQVLIKKLKQYEVKRGRDPEAARWSARIIDLDIISYGNLVIETESLIIPHPAVEQRLFVLQPLQDVAPEWRHPRTGRTVGELLAEAPDMEITKLEKMWDDEKSI